MERSKSKAGIFTAIGLIVLIIIAVMIFLWSINRQEAPLTTTDEQPTTTASVTPITDVDDESYISYTIPDGWTEQRCTSNPGVVFIYPETTTDFNCDSNRNAPMTISKDSASTADCDQFKDQPGASNHSCTAVTVDGRSTIVESTTYTDSPDYPENTTVSNYFISTDRGVVAITYTYVGEGTYTSTFESFAKTAKVKN